MRQGLKRYLDRFIQLWSVVADRDIITWRNSVSDSVFIFFAVFGFFAFVPALVLSIIERSWIVTVAVSLVYLFCIVITLIRKIPSKVRVYTGVIVFYLLGVFILFVLGPRGAGGIWLFASVVLAAFLLDNLGVWIMFMLYSVTQIVFYIMLRTGFLAWPGMDYQAWLIKAANFIFLNLVIVIVSTIYQRGFNRLLNNRTETRNASIIGLAKLAEYRDNETGDHLHRLQDYSVALARQLSRHPDYQGYITREYLNDLHISSILHDIGKVGISDRILLKPGPLDEQEFEWIRKHPRMGYDVIVEIEKNISTQSFYTIAKEIALHHHEKWDGSGYPNGLAGRRIPLSARLVALVDAYDAMTSDRPYKSAVSHEEALEIIRDERGAHFDPDIVDAFLEVHSGIARIFADKSGSRLSADEPQDLG